MKKTFILNFSGFKDFEDFQILFFQMFIRELPLKNCILFIIIIFYIFYLFILFIFLYAKHSIKIREVSIASLINQIPRVLTFCN